MNLFPSALAPCKAKKSPPGRTFRESQAICRISRLCAPAGRAVSTPWNTSLSFLPLSAAPARAECFRWLSVWFVAASCTCSSWLNPIFILMPYPALGLCDLRCRCSELHGDLCASPHFRSRDWCLIPSKTAANENGFQPQSKGNLRDLAHRLSREVRHLNVAPFILCYGHGRGLTLSPFPIWCG